MLIFGSLLILAALACLYIAMGLFGEQETVAARRLREAIAEEEIVVGGSAKLKDTNTESFARRFTPTALIEKVERNYMLAGRP